MRAWGIRRRGGACKEVNAIEDIDAFLFFKFSIFAGDALWPSEINEPTFFWKVRSTYVEDTKGDCLMSAYASWDESDEKWI